MTSLKTILECSELSEKEIESCSRLFRRPIQSNLSSITERVDDNNICTSDEEDVVNQLMMNLDK